MQTLSSVPSTAKKREGKERGGVGEEEKERENGEEEKGKERASAIVFPRGGKAHHTDLNGEGRGESGI